MDMGADQKNVSVKKIWMLEERVLNGKVAYLIFDVWSYTLVSMYQWKCQCFNGKVTIMYNKKKLQISFWSAHICHTSLLVFAPAANL